jgi:hypothetical protein
VAFQDCNAQTEVARKSYIDHVSTTWRASHQKKNLARLCTITGDFNLHPAPIALASKQISRRSIEFQRVGIYACPAVSASGFWELTHV